MNEQPIRIAAEPLRRLVAAIVAAAGSEADEAEIVAEHLVRSNLAGHDSHGVGMLPAYVHLVGQGLLRPNTPARLVKDEGAILIFDGDRGYGQRVGREAMTVAIERTREHGLAMMALRNTTHLGRIGTYGEQSLDAGLVSLHFVNVTDHRPLVAPFGGSDPRFSTNPICFAMPGTDKSPPVLLDMATARIALGKVRVARNRGERVPAGSLIDAAGQPTDDPAVMFDEPHGSLVPFGEHKGYGLALFCELLAGVLCGGGTMQPENPRRGGIINSMLTLILDPERLVEQSFMKREIDAVIAWAKASPPASAEEPVLVAGDPERAHAVERGRDGIPIDAATWGQILGAAERVGIERDRAAALTGIPASPAEGRGMARQERRGPR